MDAQIVLQWLPGVLLVAVVAFPSFFLIRRHLLIQLLAACVCVAAVLFTFGMLLGHEFKFWRTEDLPPWVLGLV
ncbi:MAG TPA: hypothetical protein VFJ70_21845, partial [Burkholderiales bacterium]|nr:hypothetical protein [Burkholderiales bacterium]